MKEWATIALLAPESLASPDHGRLLFDMLTRFVPELLPERFGNFEPLSNRVEPGGVDEAIGLWREPFLWCNRHHATQGSAWTRSRKNRFAHSAVYIAFVMWRSFQDRIVDFLL